MKTLRSRLPAENYIRDLRIEAFPEENGEKGRLKVSWDFTGQE